MRRAHMPYGADAKTTPSRSPSSFSRTAEVWTRRLYSMKRNIIITLMILASASFAAAQAGFSPATDVLGAHLNYGRGCAACHAPHSGARGNGITTTDTGTGDIALWGQDVAAL